MAVDIRLIITDAAPLITLAVAQSLDYLLYPGLPVLSPDAVFHEATAEAGKLGAQEIIDWYRAHMDAARIEPTDTFQRETRVCSHLNTYLTSDLSQSREAAMATPAA